MKIIKLLPLFVAATLILSSCSSNETLSEEHAKKNLLKTFKVKRDATGAYFLDFDLDLIPAPEIFDCGCLWILNKYNNNRNYFKNLKYLFCNNIISSNK